MNERRMQFRVGVVVFFTFIVGGLLATLNGPLPTGWLPWGTGRYHIGIQLPDAPGVGPNTPIRKNGILIGRVSAIDDTDAGVLLKANIDGDRPLFKEYQPHVRTSVLGDATIDFLTRPVPQGSQPVPDGTVFNGVVDPNPFDSLAKLGDLKEEFGHASDSLALAGDEVAKLARRINTAFGDETTDNGRINRLMDTTENAMHQFAATMTAFNEIIGDDTLAGPPVEAQRFTPPAINGQPPANVEPQPASPSSIEGRELRRNIREGLNQLPEAVRDARLTMQHFRETLQLADKNLRNLEGFTDALGQKGADIAGALLNAVDGLDKLVEDFTVLTQALNNKQGTIGQLIHDGKAYENLNRLMCNANTVLGQIYELTRNARPIVENVKIFTDKIAREPGRIATGGLNPSPIK